MKGYPLFWGFLLALCMQPIWCQGQDIYEPDGTWVTATHLEIGSAPQSHTLDPLSDKDCFHFYAQAGSTPIIEISNASGIVSEMWLYHANGTQELDYARSDGSGDVQNRIVFPCAYTGEYFLRVGDQYNDNTGSYDIRILSDRDHGAEWGIMYEPNDVYENASPISASDGPVFQEIAPVNDQDCFSLSCVAGVTYQIECVDVSGITPEMWLFDADRKRQMAYARANGNGSVSSRIVWTCFFSDIYFLRVADQYNDQMGYYTLRVLPTADNGAQWDSGFEPNENSYMAAPLVDFAQTLNLSISPSSDRDWFWFSAKQGNTYVIEAIDVTGIMTEIWLYEEDALTERGYARGNGSSNVQSRLSWTCAMDGKYYIRLGDQYNDNLGNYKLRITPSGNGVPIRPYAPTPTNGAIAQGVDTVLSWSGGDADGDTPVLYDALLSSDPVLLEDNPVSTGQSETGLSQTLLYDTTYFWQVTSHDPYGNSTTGPVWYFKTQRDPQEKLDEFEPNETPETAAAGLLPTYSVKGTIDLPGDTDYFVLKADAGQTIYLTLLVPSSMNFNLNLYDADGVPVGSSANGPGTPEYVTYESLAGGDFYVQVLGASASENSASAYYHLSVSGITDLYEPDDFLVAASALAPGFQGQAHMIDGYGDIDWFSFDAQAGESFLIELFGAKGITPEMWFYDRNGTSQIDYGRGEGTGIVNARIDWKCSSSGTYFVKVGDQYNDNIGGYYIRLLNPGAGYQWDLESEPDDTWLNAYPILTDYTVYHQAIAVKDDRDYFKFDAVHDRTYTIETLNSRGIVSELWLYGMDGKTELDYDRASGTGACDARIVWTCATTGTYFVRVGDQYNDDPGTYDIRIYPAYGQGAIWDDEYEPDDTLYNASLYNAFNVNTGAFTNPDSDIDYFRFYALQGNEYTLEVQRLSGYITPQLRLYDTNGTSQIGYSRSGSGNADARIIWTCPFSGTYFAAINDQYNDDNGEYYFRILADTGVLRVNIAPQAAIDAEARWYVEGDGTLYESGSEHSLPYGGYVIGFTDVQGWTTPVNQTVSVSGAGDTVITGTYLSVSGEGEGENQIEGETPPEGEGEPSEGEPVAEGEGEATSRTITIGSEPVEGVPIQISPPDTDGQGNGATTFVRRYLEGTVVTLTAPKNQGNNIFQGWSLNGSHFSNSLTINLSMYTDYTLTAKFWEIPDPRTSHLEKWDEGTGQFLPLNLPVEIDKKVVVLVHGWNRNNHATLNDEGEYPWQELASALSTSNEHPTVLAWDWLKKAESVLGVQPTGLLVDEGLLLARALQSDAVLSDGDRIHLIGHSLGAGVATWTAYVLRADLCSLPVRLTLFDAPENIVPQLSGVFPWSGPVRLEGLVKRLALEETYPVLIENYVTEFGVPYSAGTNIYLKDAADAPGADWFWWNDHGLGNAWYRCTVEPNTEEMPGSPEGESLENDLKGYYDHLNTHELIWRGVEKSGYAFDAFNDSGLSFYPEVFPKEHFWDRTRYYAFSLQTEPTRKQFNFKANAHPNYVPVYEEHFDDLASWGIYGSAESTAGEMHLQTTTAVRVEKNVESQPNIDVLSFTYRFEKENLDDTLALQINGECVRIIHAFVLESGTMLDSGLIDLSPWAGMTLNVAFTLISGSGGEANAVIDDLVFATEVWPETDVDGDGLLDVQEGVGDPDGDLIPNYMDDDADGDGMLDLDEGDDDPDGDGLPNRLDWDSDKDLMPDSWEFYYQLNPLQDDANEDPDGDMSSNYEEFLYETDPRNTDSFPSPPNLSVSTNLVFLSEGESAATVEVLNLGDLPFTWEALSYDPVVTVTPEMGENTGTITVQTSDFTKDRTVNMIVINMDVALDIEVIEVRILSSATEGESIEGEILPEGEGEPPIEGEGEVLPEGEGEVVPEGEGEVLPEGEGEVVPEGEGESLPEGEGEVTPEGEGESLPEGEGEVCEEGEGESLTESEGEACGCCSSSSKSAQALLGDWLLVGLALLVLFGWNAKQR